MRLRRWTLRIKGRARNLDPLLQLEATGCRGNPAPTEGESSSPPERRYMTPDDFKAWRKSMDWSQGEAADALGISRGSVENYERGSRREDGRPVEIPGSVTAIVHLYDELAKEQRQLDFLESLGGTGIISQTIERPEWHDTTLADAQRQKERVEFLNELLETLTGKKPT